MGDNRKYVIVKRMNDEDTIELTSKGEELIFKERTSAIQMARLWEKFSSPDIKFIVKEQKNGV